MYKAIVFVVLLISCTVNAADADWTDQASWGGSCNTGATNQSPINIDPKDLKYCSALDFNSVQFACADFTTGGVTNGQTATVPAVDGSTVFVDSKFDSMHYRGIGVSDQFHVHAPSEHTIKGQSYPLELHIVHLPIDKSEWNSKIDSSNLEAVTQFTAQQLKDRFNDGATTVDPFAIVVGYLFEVDDSVTDTNILGYDGDKLINLKTVFDCTATRFFYRYSGSLTTPPCTEGVQFMIAREPIKISQTELDLIKTKIANPSNRDIQELNGRTVRLAGPPCHPSDGTA